MVFKFLRNLSKMRKFGMKAYFTFNKYSQMDPINDYNDVIVISDDDDAIGSEFKDEDNLGDKDNHLMSKNIFYKYIKTRFDIPDNSIIKEKNIIEKRYHCHYCELIFPKDRLLLKHLKNYHQLQNTNKKITSKYCGKLFRFNFQLNRHDRRKMYQYKSLLE
ncbi:zinc finger protein 121-like [Aphis craccivora]|uniref:Zinc finger protein 121-like n=1 Tax=Aphis craccivora TaxID=307492 RepID=A0A6G0YE53_APHCR|nr:zinc finger protein 121-like [Aphis craccivora]